MKHFKYSFIVFFIFLFINVFSQVPQGMNYQGVARDILGQAMPNQDISLQLSILDGSETGTSVYSEIHYLTTNELGLFSVSISEGSTVNNFSLIPWSNGNTKWLKVEMDVIGGTNFTLIGTSQLLTVPFAFYSLESANGTSQWFTSGNGIYYNTGNVAIGTNSADNSAILELNSTSKGFLPPVMTEAQRDLISTPAVGLMIYNLDSDCINIFKSNGWWELCGNCITPPTPIASSNDTVCDGFDLYLYATTSAGATGYTWSGPNGFTSNNQNPIIYSINSSHAGTYSVYASNSCGNSPSTSTSLIVDNQPTIANAGTDQTGLAGNSTSLNGNTPVIGTGTWSIFSGTGGNINDINNPASTFTGQPDNSYELVWEISNFCGVSSDIVIIGFAPFVFVCGDTLTDIRDGKKYPTVQIGSQCWMTKNMNIGVRLDGDSVQSDNGVYEKYCYGNDTTYCDTYGGLYQWNELMQYSISPSAQGICPVGWHIPSDWEIIILEMAVGMDTATANTNNIWRGTDEGTKIKPGGTSGFDFLMGGRCNNGNSFSLAGSYGYLHTSTESGSMNYRRCLSSAASTIGRYNTFPKTYGMSVRCVKD